MLGESLPENGAVIEESVQITGTGLLGTVFEHLNLALPYLNHFHCYMALYSLSLLR